MAVRTLSDLESKLVMELEWQEKKLVTLQDMIDILDCSYAHARKLAHQLERKRWLDRLEPGKYQFIPANRGSEAVPDMNPLLAGSVLIAPYYYSYATANHFYGFTPQVPATVYIATTKTKRPTEIRGVDLEKLADYALRMESKALVQRLGYLLETLGNSLPPGLEDRLLSGIGKSKTYLGPASRWGTGGDYDPKWQVVVNVPAQQIMGEIRVMS